MARMTKKRKAILAAIIILRIRRRRRRQRNIWIRSWIMRRKVKGAFNTLIRELEVEDPDMFKRYFRVSSECFQTLLRMVGPTIKKADTVMRKSISPEERLAVTLRYLATGETFHSLSFSYRIGERTISNIITETCQALYGCLKDEYMKIPTTEDEWTKISDDFKDKWNYPFCLGAIDGKHIALRQPPNSGSEFFNYKHFFQHTIACPG